MDAEALLEIADPADNPRWTVQTLILDVLVEKPMGIVPGNRDSGGIGERPKRSLDVRLDQACGDRNPTMTPDQRMT